MKNGDGSFVEMELKGVCDLLLRVEFPLFFGNHLKFRAVISFCGLRCTAMYLSHVASEIRMSSVMQQSPPDTDKVNTRNAFLPHSVMNDTQIFLCHSILGNKASTHLPSPAPSDFQLAKFLGLPTYAMTLELRGPPCQTGDD